MAKKRFWAALAAVLLAAVSVLLYILSFPIDLTERPESVVTVLERTTGKRVTTGSIVVKAFPFPEIALKDLKLFDGDEVVLEIDSARIRSRTLLPFVFIKTPVIESAEIAGARLRIRRKAGEGLSSAWPFTMFKGGRPPTIRSMDLSGGEVTFIDESVEPPSSPPKPLVFKVTGIKASIYRQRGVSAYRIDGVLLPSTRMTFTGNIGADNEGVKGTASIRDIDIARFNPYIKRLTGGDVKTEGARKVRSASGAGGAGGAGAAGGDGIGVSGTVEVESSYSLNGGLESRSVIRHREITFSHPAFLRRPINSANGALTLNLNVKEGSMEASISNLDAEVENLSLKGSAGLTLNLEDKTGTVRTHISSSPITFEFLRGLLPSRAVPLRSKALKAFESLSGTIGFEDIEISASLSDIKKGDILKRPGLLKVKASIHDAAFSYEGLGEPLTGINGEVEYGGDSLTISNFIGRHGYNAIQEFKGEIKDVWGSPFYILTLKADIDTGGTVKTLRGLLVSIGKGDLALKLGGIQSTGGAELDLNVRGVYTGAPGYVPLHTGVLRLKGVDIKSEDPAIEISGLKGDVSFDNNRFVFENVIASGGGGGGGEGGGGRAGGALPTLVINGHIAGLREKEPSFNIRVEGSLDRDTLIKLARTSYAEKLVFDGNAAVAASASGTREDFKASSRLDFTSTTLEYGSLVKKDRAVPFSVKAEMKVRKKDVAIDALSVRFRRSSVSVSGGVLEGGNAYDLTARSENINLSDLDDVSPYFVKEFNSAGNLSFEFKARKEAGKEGIYEGEASIKDGSFRTPFLPNPVEGINASIRFGDEGVTANLQGVKTGETEASGSFAYAKGKEITFDLDSPSFNLDDLMPVKGRPAGPVIGDDLRRLVRSLFEGPEETEALLPAAQKRVTGKGRIRIRKGSLRAHQFADFDIEVAVDEEAVRLSPVSLAIDGGSITGTVIVHRDPSSQLLFSSETEIRGIDLEKLFSAFGAKKEILTGRLDATLNLSGNRGSDPFLKGINGKVEMSSEKGRLWEFLVMAKIFSIVNILSIDELFKQGLPYKYIKGDFTVKDGVFSTRNLRMYSDSVRMSGVGEIDLPDAYIDGVLALHPFVTIDKIITNIPLAGWIIGGEKKSTISMYYDVVGPLNDPEVTPVPTRSLSEDLFGIFRRILEAPIEVLTGGNND